MNYEFFFYCVLFLSLGFACGQAYRADRTRVVSRALDASKYLLAVAEGKAEILAREIVRRDVALANIKKLAMRVHIERVLNLSGKGLLPAPAERAGQHHSHRITTQLRGTSGPSGSDGLIF